MIYSYGVYDASGGIEITVPDYDLYHIVHVFDENHITLAVVYPGETVNITKEDLTYGDHVYLFMRTQRRSMDEEGLKELNKRQDAVVIKNGSSKPYISEVKYDPGFLQQATQLYDWTLWDQECYSSQRLCR